MAWARLYSPLQGEHHRLTKFQGMEAKEALADKFIGTGKVENLDNNKSDESDDNLYTIYTHRSAKGRRGRRI